MLIFKQKLFFTFVIIYALGTLRWYANRLNILSKINNNTGAKLDTTQSSSRLSNKKNWKNL